jgi:hypothetical protein
MKKKKNGINANISGKNGKEDIIMVCYARGGTVG